MIPILFFLTVLDNAECNTSSPLRVTVGEDVAISCKTKASQPLLYKWMKVRVWNIKSLTLKIKHHCLKQNICSVLNVSAYDTNRPDLICRVTRRSPPLTLCLWVRWLQINQEHTNWQLPFTTTNSGQTLSILSMLFQRWAKVWKAFVKVTAFLQC